MNHQPLPPPLMTSEPGSYAEYTIRERKPQILADVSRAYAYPAEVVAALDALAEELAHGEVEPLREEAADAAFWRSAWAPWEGRTWWALPWFFAETFFYRRLLEAVRYFQPGAWQGVDPFAPQKRAMLSEGLAPLEAFLRGLDPGLSAEETFSRWLYRSLWGNRADLSNVAVSASAYQAGAHRAEDLLVDHSAQAYARLAAAGGARVDWVADNAGLELLCDLGAMDMLLSSGLAARVRVHLKPQPYFVSDAMPKDLDAAMRVLSEAAEGPLRALGARLAEHLRAGRLEAETHSFWATCLFYTQLPPDLRGRLAEADLLVLKGDVNYRRLLEDRHWPPTTPLEEITRYMPAPFVALRTLKAELIAGLPAGLAEQIAAEDPAWLINGRRGLIHLVSAVRGPR